MVVWGAMQPLTGALADRRGTRPVILGGILCSTLGFLTLGTAQSLWQIALGFGVLIGTTNSACGLMMWALLIAKWFPGARRAAADRWGRVPILMATYLLRGLGALALAVPVMPAWWFYVAVALAPGPVFATVTINNVQTFELVGSTRAGLILGVSFVVHQVAAAGRPLRQWPGL
jgi:MFS family permease